MCRYVAVNPIWESGMQGLYISAHAGPIYAAADQDGDGVYDHLDNCVYTANADQANDDADLYGNACDNCPAVANDDQADADLDGFGDACDVCPTDPLNDADEDGAAAFTLAGRAVEAGYDLKLLCRELARLVRDLLVLSVDPTRFDDPDVAPESDRERLTALLPRFSREDLLRSFDLA